MKNRLQLFILAAAVTVAGIAWASAAAAAGPAMTVEQFRDFINSVTGPTDMKARLEVVRSAASASWFTSDQVVDVIGYMYGMSGDLRVEAAAALYPHVTDPASFHKVYSRLSGEQAERLRKLTAAPPPTAGPPPPPSSSTYRALADPSIHTLVSAAFGKLTLRALVGEENGRPTLAVDRVACTEKGTCQLQGGARIRLSDKQAGPGSEIQGLIWKDDELGFYINDGRNEWICRVPDTSRGSDRVECTAARVGDRPTK